MIVEVDNINGVDCHIKSIYIKDDDFRIKEIDKLPEYSLRSIALADAVIDQDGLIIKNRWGVEDIKPYTELLNTMTYKEIEKLTNDVLDGLLCQD